MDGRRRSDHRARRARDRHLATDGGQSFVPAPWSADVAAPLAWDLFDVASGSSLVGGPPLGSRWTPPNTDSPGDTGSKSVFRQVPPELGPGALWRIHMRVGHQDASMQDLVIDDAADFEIRIE